MIRLIQRRLIIPRGDTGSFSIPVLSKGGTDNIAVFTIFDETTRTKMFQKIISGEGDVLTIAFTHSDTVNLKPGKYVWDIKYYKNPEYIDDELVNGEEIDSYYAGFSLPVCEIRETADNYLVSPEAPTATLSPEQLEIVTGAIHSLNEAIRKTQENVEHYPKIRDEVWYVWDAELGDYVSTNVQANGIVGNGIASAVLNNDYTLTLNFTDGTSFTSPSIRGQKGNGIDDIVLNNNFTLTISYTDGGSYTTPSIRGPIGPTPQFSIGTVQDGAVAAASVTGTAENPVLNLTLPNAHVPTRVSQLENDAGYLTQHQDLSDYVQKTDYATASKAGVVKVDSSYTGINIASDGTLRTNPATSFQIKAGASGYQPLQPGLQHTSTFYGLAKAAGDTTQSQSSNAVGTYTNEAKAAIQTMLDVPSTSDIPTQVSELTNDAGYLTTETDPTVPAWAKAAQKPTYTASEVGAPTVAEMNTAIGTAIGQINSFDMAVVQTLPAQNISTHTIYLVPKTGETNDVYDEYVYINNNWEMVGNTQIDLSNYVQKTDYASDLSYGVVSTESNFGIRSVDGVLSIVYANTSDIKEATNYYKPIGPRRVKHAAFYGLAQAAGDTTQSQSDNSVGTYTNEAKGAIQQMLGVSDLIATAENSLVASKAYAIGDIFTANGKLYKATAAIAADAAIIPAVEGEEIAGANCEETSVGEGFVKFTDYATDAIPGVIKVWNTYGVGMISQGNLRIFGASDAEAKAGAHNYRPITPNRQHSAAFYGLAKAAGDTTQAASNNAVGTYTDDAKAAIKNMLGITQTLTVTVLTQDNVTVTGQTVTVRADNSEGEVYATAAYEGQPVSFSLPTGFQFYVSVSDTLDHHFNPTTARGVIKDANVAVTLQYSDFSTIRTAPDIKAALNAGMDLTDLVGEQITCTKDSDTLTWDVVDYDATNKSVKLLLHDCFGTANMIFEPAQALMWCENELAAGAYTFKNDTTSYYFTLTQAIPAGGQLVASDDGTFKTYESQSAMATLETGTVSTTEIAGATDLGTTATGLLNHNSRVRYGSNNYAESALLWWLNTDAPAGTLREPITKFSRAYSYNVPGFLSNLDADFIACLDEVEWLCSTNNTYECPKELGGYTNGIRQAYTITKKIGLASEMEIFGSYGGTSDGSTVFDLYNDAENTDRVKYRGTSAQVWWLRSPYWGNAYSERHVNSSGGADSYGAYGSCAVVPACQISKTAE